MPVRFRVYRYVTHNEGPPRLIRVYVHVYSNSVTRDLQAVPEGSFSSSYQQAMTASTEYKI